MKIIIGIMCLLCLLISIGIGMLIIVGYLEECEKEEISNREWHCFSADHKGIDIGHRYILFKEYYKEKYEEPPYMPYEVQDYFNIPRK